VPSCGDQREGKTEGNVKNARSKKAGGRYRVKNNVNCAQLKLAATESKHATGSYRKL
jgi:hypothetical protein